MTHLVVDDKNQIFISPDLGKVFNFLIEIEKEVESVLSYEGRLVKIKRQTQEVLSLTQELAKSPPDNFSFTPEEDLNSLADKFTYFRPIRAEQIIIFSYLDVIRALHAVYELKARHDDKRLRDASDQALESFYRDFCLSKQNSWIIANPDRAGRIGASVLRKHRNKLVHFFSPGEIGIVPTYEKWHQSEENRTNNAVKFLSPADLYAITQGAARLLLKKWDSDFQKDEPDFKSRIGFVIEIVDNHGAVLLHIKPNAQS